MQNKFITRKEFEERLIQLFAQNRISAYPRKRRDRHILLKSIVMTLANGKDYTETEINQAIKAWLTGMHNPRGLDHVALRRYLVDEGYVDRSRNGSRYWVITPGPSTKLFEPDVGEVDVFSLVGEAKETHDKSRRKRGEVRQKILDAATELFSQKGYDGVSIRDIASKAGITIPNIYYYFKDKKGLYQATLQGSADNVLEILKKIDDPNASFRDRFVALAKAKMRLAKQKNPAFELFLKEWVDRGGSPEFPPQLETVMSKSFKYMEEMIAQAVQRGEIRPINPKLGVWYLIGLIFMRSGKFLSKYMKTREVLSDDEVEEFVDLILKGLEKK